MIADNRIPEQATWDFQALKSNFSALIEIDFDVELTGFTTGEVDLIIDESTEPEAETCDEIFSVDGPAVSRLGEKVAFRVPFDPVRGCAAFGVLP